MSAPAASKLSWVAYLAPFLPTYLLIHVSGIPAMHKVNFKKWGTNPQYQKHLAETPAVAPFVPLPPNAMFLLPAAAAVFGVARALARSS